MRTRRFKKAREPRKIFLVICEGETEKTYVELLRQHYRLPITIKTKVSGNAINKRLVVQYCKEMNLESHDDYMVFFMYDCDVEDIVEKLKKLEGTLLLSNPCIEFWFLLHLKDWSSSLSSFQAVKNLILSHPDWANYEKGKLTAKQREILLSEKMKAVSRAERFPYFSNPSTNINKFIEILKKEKNG